MAFLTAVPRLSYADRTYVCNLEMHQLRFCAIKNWFKPLVVFSILIGSCFAVFSLFVRRDLFLYHFYSPFFVWCLRKAVFLDCGISCVSTHILHDRNLAFSSNANPNYKFVFSPCRVFYFMNEILKQSTDSRKSTLQKK